MKASFVGSIDDLRLWVQVYVVKELAHMAFGMIDVADVIKHIVISFSLETNFKQCYYEIFKTKRHVRCIKLGYTINIHL